MIGVENLLALQVPRASKSPVQQYSPVPKALGRLTSYYLTILLVLKFFWTIRKRATSGRYTFVFAIGLTTIGGNRDGQVVTVDKGNIIIIFTAGTGHEEFGKRGR